MTVRVWLRQNGYPEIADLIDCVMKDWKKRGVKTRRNWWEVLAGGKNGSARIIDGIEFPVLKSAQKHQGVSVTENAIQRNKVESVPKRSYHGKSLNEFRKKINSKGGKSTPGKARRRSS